MGQVQYRVTKEGLEKLEKQIQGLEKKADEISKQRADAAGMGGDWHDNFAFEQLIRDEQMVGQQIKELRKKLACAVIIENEIQNGEMVDIGTSVEIEFEDGERKEYILTDPQVANPSEGKISYASPLGQAIIGARLGESRIYKVKETKFQVKIIRIRRRNDG